MKLREEMKKEQNTNHGITLIALVVTIVILIILATISIGSLFGENGLIKKAQEAKQYQANAISMEQGAMDKLETYANLIGGGSGVPAPPTDTTGPTVNIEVVTVTETSIQVKVTATDESGLAESDTYKFFINDEEKEKNTTGEFTFEGLTVGTKYTIKVEVKDKVGNLGSATKEVTSVATIDTERSYVGYYADVDRDGTVDGVIYADLAIGGSGSWTEIEGWHAITYTYPKVTSGLKQYYVSSESYTGFGGKWTKPVITALEGIQGTDRFYVMALEDFNAGTNYYWYNSAYGNMGDYSTATSKDFGTGKENTATMIAKWNGIEYGGQNTGSYPDMWGVIQKADNKGKTWDLNRWFIPSKEEWDAFGEFAYRTMKVGKSNYGQFGLGDHYWTSSQETARTVYGALFDYVQIGQAGANEYGRVRLGATF